MDIWLILNGEKTGPVHDFEIRKRIENGELQPDTPAWHEGQPAWLPLCEIDLFTREFLRDSENQAHPVPSEDAPDAELSPAPSAHPIRRFWARWFDLYLYAGFWWITMYVAGRDIGAIINNGWVMLFQFVPWFALEAFLIHRFGTTPGKWLLGLRVSNNDGSHLDLADSTRRAARVLFLGLGFGWGVLSLVCQIVAYFTIRRVGKPLWDHAGGHQLTAEPIHPVRVSAYVISLFAALMLQSAVLWPYTKNALANVHPALKEQMEKNPPWHLPVK